ncbi:hypothetical protein LTR39_000432 [Cryomyces antarcticus]|nr:hypothetical protein LTR39_000432 [Cryomyces antarcticus]
MNTLHQSSHIFALLPRRTTASLGPRALAFHLRPQPQQQQFRPFITNPFTPSVQSLSATRTLPYPAKAIYSIIADVSQYSNFLPYCQDSSITRYSSPDADGKKWPSEAKLVVGWNNISETFYSRIYCVPGSIVEAVGGATKTTLKEEEIAHHESGRNTEVEDKTTDESILTHLMTRWTVKPFPYKPPPPSNNVPSDLPAREQTEVSLAIEFQFANPIYGSMSKAAAPKVAGMMIEAFEQRVKSVLDGPGYGGNDKKAGRMEGLLGKESPWQHAIYTVDPTNNTSTSTLSTPVNKGHESMAYLTYIIENFHSLPTTIAFLHSHHSGFFNAWHTDAPMHDNVYAMKHLQLDFVQRSGYVNLRCKWNPGCNKAHRRNTHITPEVWQEVFDGTSTPPVMNNGTSGTDPEVAEKAIHVPAEIATPCCAQFAVSREQVLKRPLEDYVKFRRWIIDTKLDDAKSGRVMEYLWHIIFGMEAVR